MAECYLDLIFLIRDRPFVFSGWGVGVGAPGGGADIFQQLKLDFFIDKVKVFFCVIQLSTIGNFISAHSTRS